MRAEMRSEELVVKTTGRGQSGFIVETASGEGVALTFHGGRRGREWAEALVNAFNNQKSVSEQSEGTPK